MYVGDICLGSRLEKEGVSKKVFFRFGGFIHISFDRTVFITELACGGVILDNFHHLTPNL